MEPEKLNYNISDFAMTTYEKRTVVSLSSVRYLNGQLSQNIEKTILILIVCKGTKKNSNMQVIY